MDGMQHGALSFIMFHLLCSCWLWALSECSAPFNMSILWDSKPANRQKQKHHEFVIQTIWGFPHLPENPETVPAAHLADAFHRAGLGPKSEVPG